MCCHVDGWQCKLMYSMIEALPVRKKYERWSWEMWTAAGFCLSHVYSCKFSLFEQPTTVITVQLQWLASIVENQIRLCQLSGLSVHMEIAEKHTHRFSLILVACVRFVVH